MAPGQRIYDAAREGDMAALRPLVQEWSGREYVLNWANPDKMGYTPLHIGSREGKVEAVRLLLVTPGEARCCPRTDDLFVTSYLAVTLSSSAQASTSIR